MIEWINDFKKSFASTSNTDFLLMATMFALGVGTIFTIDAERTD